MNIKGIKSKNLGMFSIKLDCASYKLDTKLFIFQPTSSLPSYPKEMDWTKFVGMVVGNAYNNITWSQPLHSSAKLAPQSTMPTANPAIKLRMLTIIFILIEMILDITFFSIKIFSKAMTNIHGRNWREGERGGRAPAPAFHTLA